MSIGKDLYECSRWSRLHGPNIKQLNRGVTHVEEDVDQVSKGGNPRLTHEHWTKLQEDLQANFQQSESKQSSRLIHAGPNQGSANPNYAKNRSKFDAQKSVAFGGGSNPQLYAISSAFGLANVKAKGGPKTPLARRRELRQLGALVERFEAAEQAGGDCDYFTEMDG